MHVNFVSSNDSGKIRTVFVGVIRSTQRRKKLGWVMKQIILLKDFSILS